MLAIEYALTQPVGLVGLILANSTASAPLWGAEAHRLRADLPPDVQATLARHESAGTTDSPEYQAAMEVFYPRHVIRVQPMPDFVRRSFDRIGQPYGVMWGPSEFHITGNLADWDRTPRLAEIRMPTLLISGEHDESTPAINRALQRGIPGARWVLMRVVRTLPISRHPSATCAPWRISWIPCRRRDVLAAGGKPIQRITNRCQFH